MADTDTETVGGVCHADEEAFYWVREYVDRGMLIGQAETLAYGPGVDRHAVREALEQGCKPLTAFQIYAPLLV